MKTTRLALITLILVVPLTAQTAPPPDDPPFWTEPDAVVKDSTGRVISREARDRTNYMLKTYGSGGKLKATYHFMPHTEHITFVETPEATEQYLYDDHGQLAGYQIQMGSLSFKGRATREGVLSAPGMPTVTVHRDMYDRVIDVRMDGRAPIATYTYDNSGHLSDAAFDGYSLSFTPPADGLTTETLKGRRGDILHQARVNADKHGDAHDCSLDPVADDFGLGRSWATQVKFEYTSTSTITTVRNADGRVALYLMTVGPHRIGFDSHANALFYEIDTYAYNSFGRVPGAETSYNPIVEQDAVVPKRLVITSDGRVGACVEAAALGAITSLWTKHDGGGHLFYRTETPAGTTTNSPPRTLQTLPLNPRLHGVWVTAGIRSNLTRTSRRE